MNWYPTQSHFPGTKPTSPCPILIILNVWLRSDKYKCSSHLNQSTMVRNHDFEFRPLPKWKKDAQLIRPYRLVYHMQYTRGEEALKSHSLITARSELRWGLIGYALHWGPEQGQPCVAKWRASAAPPIGELGNLTVGTLLLTIHTTNSVRYSL